MFRLDLGTTQKYCDGLSRRSFLQVGVSSLAALGMSDVLRSRAMAAPAGAASRRAAP
jgi:hypothetical protein